MKSLRVIKVSYDEELPEESRQLILHLLEAVVINQIEASPQLKGMLLKAGDKYRKELNN